MVKKSKHASLFTHFSVDENLVCEGCVTCDLLMMAASALRAIDPFEIETLTVFS